MRPGIEPGGDDSWGCGSRRPPSRCTEVTTDLAERGLDGHALPGWHPSLPRGWASRQLLAYQFHQGGLAATPRSFNADDGRARRCGSGACRAIELVGDRL